MPLKQIQTMQTKAVTICKRQQQQQRQAGTCWPSNGSALATIADDVADNNSGFHNNNNNNNITTVADRIATTTTPMDFVYATAVFTPPAAPTASNLVIPLRYRSSKPKSSEPMDGVKCSRGVHSIHADELIYGANSKFRSPITAYHKPEQQQ